MYPGGHSSGVGDSSVPLSTTDWSFMVTGTILDTVRPYNSSSQLGSVHTIME